MGAKTNGNRLTDYLYNNVADYKRGFASAYDDTDTFFIDKFGKIAEDLPIVKGSGTLAFVGSLIEANVDYRLSYFGGSPLHVISSSSTSFI